MLQVIFSATNAFCKYIKEDLARLPSPDGKRIGTQPITTDANTISWQVHAIKGVGRRRNYTDVIAVEARSRYAILFSHPQFSSLEDFVKRFGRRWANEGVDMAVESGATVEEQVQTMFDQFLAIEKEMFFCRNTDLSVNGHVSDADWWLSGSYENYGHNILTEPEETWLGMERINCVHKKAKPFPGAKHQESFIPMSRMVDDWLFRFARGLSQWDYPQTPDGDFPNPFPISTGTDEKRAVVKKVESYPVPDNVISLDEARKRKSRV
ncbi:hypothetical protein [Endozoicomonas ascidiicola]|uniref:hypothetical protein n=1 Tax=Endozoicomonas ascidiicola TaxID=1698521 RepID=UPI00082D8A68|nr:hypothetical protein [Endozoicomonas ascidiicola]